VRKKPTRRHGMTGLRLVRSFPYPSSPRLPSFESSHASGGRQNN
jgi:hypothetical protein